MRIKEMVREREKREAERDRGKMVEQRERERKKDKHRTRAREKRERLLTDFETERERERESHGPLARESRRSLCHRRENRPSFITRGRPRVSDRASSHGDERRPHLRHLRRRRQPSEGTRNFGS